MIPIYFLVGIAALFLVLMAFALAKRCFLFMPRGPASTEGEIEVGKTEDGHTIKGRFVKTRVADPAPDRCVLFCHGNYGNQDNCAGIAELAADIFKCDVLTFDYCGYGNSGGRACEKGVHDAADVAYQFVSNRKKEIIVFGFSLGSTAAVRLAATQPVDGLVVLNGFSRAADLVPLPSFVGRLLVPDFDMVGHAALVTCTAVVVHARDDCVVRMKHGVRLSDLLGSDVVFIEVGGSHNQPQIDNEHIRKLRELFGV